MGKKFFFPLSVGIIYVVPLLSHDSTFQKVKSANRNERSPGIGIMKEAQVPTMC